MADWVLVGEVVVLIVFFIAWIYAGYQIYPLSKKAFAFSMVLALVTFIWVPLFIGIILALWLAHVIQTSTLLGERK